VSFSLTRNRISEPGFRFHRFSVTTKSSFTNKLQGYWKFDGDGLDSSINGKNLTETGSVGDVTGLLGNAADFPGTDGNFWARGVNDTVFDVGVGFAPFTVQVWVNVDVMPGSFSWIAGKHDTDTNGWGFFFASDGTVYWDHRGGGGSEITSSPGQITTGAGWQHVVVTSDGATLKIYVDNVEVGSGSPSSVIASPNPLIFGNRFNAGRALNGQLDEVAIWTRALTNDEILVLYNSGNGLALF